ncbi:MAG: DUF1501 domain-containing protein [Planctomycetota bacterium]
MKNEAEPRTAIETFSRRSLLRRAGGGFGLIGLAGALSAGGLLRSEPRGDGTAPLKTHFPAKAKRVIFLFMNGAPSHVDTFDPKPALNKHAGEKPTGTTNKNRGSGYMGSPFSFQSYGESGVVMSELFPRLSKSADKLCVLRSMHTDVPNHEPGLLLMHSGNQQPIRPSLGSWVSYGLSTENETLPTYVVLSPGRPVVGPYLWSNAFLPGEHQGLAIDTGGDLSLSKLVANLKHPRLSAKDQIRQVDLVKALEQIRLAQNPDDAALESQIRALEVAHQMQGSASDAFDLSKESPVVRDHYGRTPFGQSCLLARRLAERGVRYTQVYYVTKKGKQPWDTHQNNDDRHRSLCADSDKATAALLEDLDQRGLLDDTLVIWGGEFGRTPYAQKGKGKPGRDHHNTGFSMFLAGGGVKGGFTYGETDEFGMHATEDRMHVHDLHATILHLLGLDHERLTYRYSGRDFRLTDVHGDVAHDIIA